jgi:hypothetical protein
MALAGRRSHLPQTISDELEILRRQKLELLAEKKLLRARIAKIEAETQRPVKSMVNPAVLAQFESEYQELYAKVEAQRKELEAVKNSDDATLRAELQEEIKIVYLERLRLQDCYTDQQKELEEAQREYALLGSDIDPDAREKKVGTFREKLEKYRRANHRLLVKIKTLRANRAFDSEEGKMKIRLRADDIRNMIEATRKETEEVKREILDSKARHRAQMRALRAKAILNDDQK